MSICRSFHHIAGLCVLLAQGSALAESYSYDPAGRLVGVVYDDGSSISYQYDANGSRLARTVTAPPDTDTDGILDADDNCTLVANPDQTDTDQDSYGNACDADFNQSGSVDFADLATLKSVFFTSDPLADLDNSGSVDFADLARFKSLFFKSPGPSGLLP